MTNPEPGVAPVHAEIRQKLEVAERIAIASHIRPDGDAVGSLLGLGLALKARGKHVQMILADPVPNSLRHLKGTESIRRRVEGGFDLAIVVDSAEFARIGGVFGERVPDIEVDHHITNEGYAQTSLVVPEAVATCAILAKFMPGWGLSFDADVASALLTGIVTDTIGFRTSNMTSEALRLAADMMDYGAHLPNLYAQSLVSKSFEAVRYWGQGLGKVQRDDGLIWTTLSLEDRKEAQYPGNDDADLVNVLSSVDGDIAVIFVEQKQGRVKISWRARPGYDVSQIALQFGGGGHAAASGAEMAGTLDSVEEQVITATRAYLSRRNNNDSTA